MHLPFYKGTYTNKSKCSSGATKYCLRCGKHCKSIDGPDRMRGTKAAKKARGFHNKFKMQWDSVQNEIQTYNYVD